MTMHSWIRKLFGRPLRKEPRRARLAVEALEQRCVPTFTVTNLLDDGSLGSLRWAVGQANATGGEQSIDFDPTVFATHQTITLSGTQLELTDTTGTETITGPAVGVTVSGNNASRVFQIDGGVSASISGLTITGGNGGSGNGGGLFNLGTTTLTDCTISGNSALGAGGVNNTGALALTNCTVSGNWASGYYGSGGGLANGGGTVTLTDCTVSGNSTGSDGFGGGLFSQGGTATLTDCTVSGNDADLGGGLASGGGTVTLTDCTVRGNSAFVGGGVNSLGGTTTLTDCTVSGNGASWGGGLSAQIGTTTLTDCTVSGNSAGRGGGLYNFGPTTLTLSNTIVAANTSGGNPSDIFGNVNGNSSYNLIGTGGSGGLIDGVNHNQVGVANPGLGTLGGHGGPTQTINLLGGSPALNAGDAAQHGLPDQRGVVRTGAVNIGAYQASATAFRVSAPDTVQPGVPFDVTVTAVDPFSQVAVGYTGTVRFSTSDPDPGVVLPADYTFTLVNGGVHTFTDTGLGEVTLVMPGDQMLTVMDTADNTITGSIVITVSAGPAPPPSTVPAQPVQGKAPAPSQPSASEVVGPEGWFASLHDGDSVWLTAPRLNHQTRGDTTLGMADLVGGDDLLFA
jgi:hypothetical protein